MSIINIEQARAAINMISFPTTTEAFIACQEAGTGRKLETFERSLAAVIVDLSNGSYREGANGTENTVTMDDVKKFYLERGHGDAFHAVTWIWESICWWCDRAYRAGKEAAQHG